MRTLGIVLAVAAVASIWALYRPRADVCPPLADEPSACLPCVSDDVDAAVMVRAVRESEQWVHQVDSLLLRVESVWTDVAQPPSAGITPEGGGATRESTGLLEYAFDRSRMRFLEDQPDRSRALKIWDGKQLIGRQWQSGQREQYLLDATPQGNFDDVLASKTAWPRSQPHAFWWDLRDVDALSAFYGRPEEFKCVGREKYHDTDCHVLEMLPTEVRAILHGQSYGCDSGMDDRQEQGLIGEVRGLADQSCRWYIGVEDGRLRGITWLIAGRPRLEHWMSDYRQVAPGCWFPMTQGYQIYNKDSEDRAYVESRRDLKVLEIKINETPADDLFQLAIREGARVQDRRSGRLMTYDYRPKPPELLGKPLPPLSQSFTQLDPALIQARPVLLCFWDVQQRPSRHCILQLAQQADRLRVMGVKVVAIQTATVEPAVLDQWTRDNAVAFPVLTLTDSLDAIRSTWNIDSLPWLILTDQTHVVKATGFPLHELQTRLATIMAQTGPWAASQ